MRVCELPDHGMRLMAPAWVRLNGALENGSTKEGQDAWTGDVYQSPPKVELPSKGPAMT